MSISIIDQVIEQLRAMPQPLQWQVLEFARTLGASEIQGVPPVSSSYNLQARSPLTICN